MSIKSNASSPARKTSLQPSSSPHPSSSQESFSKNSSSRDPNSKNPSSKNSWIREEDKNFILKELKRYESHYSAIIPSLYCIQKRHGWINSDAISELSIITKIPEAHINEVLYFYTMFNKNPVGKLHVQVCTNISCSMNGARELADHLCQTFNVKYGEISNDGLVTISRVECLGACHNAPMMQVEDNYYENLTQESAVETILKLGKDKK